MHVNEWADFETTDALPLSQGYILANLKKHGYSGHIIGEYKNRPLAPHDFHNELKRLRPEAIGFSVYEENFRRVRVWARMAKSLDPGITVVLGGPQVTFMPAEGLAQMAEVDVLCRGEGEEVMLNIARALDHGKPLTDVAGICCRVNGSLVETGECPGLEELDNLPSPYLDDTIDFRGKSRVILLSSRGCASSCTFCYTPRACARKVRYHSVERLIEEMKYLQSQGVNDFWFADPNFAQSRKRLETFLEAIINRVPGASFWCQTRYNLVDGKLLALLKRAGAHTIAFGLESAHAPTLKRINKRLDLEKMSKAVSLSQDAGIDVELFTLFGLPGESMENAMSTLDFVKRSKVRVEGNSISQQLHVFFGTPISENPAEHGISALPMAKPAYRSICRDFQTDSMSEEEIRQMSLIWRLNRQDFHDDVASATNLFSIAGFITRHKKYLDSRPEADMMLYKIYMELDEPAAAAACLERLGKKFQGNSEVDALLTGPFTCFKTKRRAIAHQGCKVIFDCKGLMHGSVVPETECRFSIATLGNSVLLADFEKGLMGMKAGSASQFNVVFPEDYGNSKLAGQRLVFQVYLYQVLEPVIFALPEEMGLKAAKNMYRFDDLIHLKMYNENLYYMVLRDSVLHSFSGNLNDMVSLLNYYLKLGFMEKAMDIAYSFPREPLIMGHVGRILQINGFPEEAIEFLLLAADTNEEIENQRIKAHIALKQYREAEEVAGDPRLATSLQTMNLRVKLASLLDLPVPEYLRRLDLLLDSQIKMMRAGI